MTVQVSEISLKERSTGGAVRAELRDAIEEQQLLDWLTAWQPLIRSVVLGLNARGVPPSQWPQSWHWNWPGKMAQVAWLLAYRGFCVTCDGLTQGLMRLNLTSLARDATQVGKPL